MLSIEFFAGYKSIFTIESDLLMECENNSSLVREKVVPFTLQHTMDTVTSSSVLLKSMELTPHQRERFEKCLISKHSLLCFFMHIQQHNHHTTIYL